MPKAKNTNNVVIPHLVNAFTEETVTTIAEIKNEYNLVTENFKGFVNWDLKFKSIIKMALQYNMVPLIRKRGSWTFVAVLDEELKDLFIFTKKANIEKVIKNFGKGNIHYFHAFVGINKSIKLDDCQMEFFTKTTSEYEEKRIDEVRNILSEDYPRVNQVIFIVAEEENRRITSVEAILYDRFFNEIEKTNYSEYISGEHYSELFVEDEDFSKDEENIVIPKIKENIKKSKSYNQIPKDIYIEKLEENEEI
ncbi:DUF5986 family protein [Staphylococcus pseudintermedius]|uniref:DUF5986 family protein n=1 Tax=Staphylococcus pseudintermedius TaxID=283734 RepID=UPI001BDF033C|nr:DUF5986 family protein [Staphylococcus pseudintermedius]EII6316065.1 hypothetical protein [Staphylococcus pseudintermedius]MCE5501337.1 hypothetical protein [Staphylococcus pseudintermedius]MCE5523486.1 hypothetical protein [Staphylococcus pseudintermedius]HAR6257584.1 hypothetical protein [Staphylococcus pseudintermedius]